MLSLFITKTVKYDNREVNVSTLNYGRFGMDIHKASLSIINCINDSTYLERKIFTDTLNLKDDEQILSIILHRGHVGIYQKENDLLVFTISSPMILCVDSLLVEKFLCIKSYGEALISFVTIKDLKCIITKENLWSEFIIIQDYLLSRFIERFSHMSMQSAYGKIKFCINEIMQQDNDKINACDYIIKRTGLSKSRVMLILKGLKDGGYVELNRGVITHIKYLPHGF